MPQCVWPCQYFKLMSVCQSFCLSLCLCLLVLHITLLLFSRLYVRLWVCLSVIIFHYCLIFCLSMSAYVSLLLCYHSVCLFNLLRYWTWHYKAVTHYATYISLYIQPCRNQRPFRNRQCKCMKSFAMQVMLDILPSDTLCLHPSDYWLLLTVVPKGQFQQWWPVQPPLPMSDYGPGDGFWIRNILLY